MNKKINKFNFPINFFNFNGKKQYFQSKLKKFKEKMNFSKLENDGINRWKIECIDLFAYLAELKVLKSLPSFPY